MRQLYNPNMLYPSLPHRWEDGDWCGTIDMIKSFGFTHFEFWLVPRLFCRDGIDSEYGREFIRQMNVIIDYAAGKDIGVIMLCSLATVGSDWMTLCPNVPADWEELRHLWTQWIKLLPGLGGVSIFPGDPGACSRNGCTALTYIDKSREIAEIIHGNLPEAGIELNTWGPPFFGWGNIQGPEGWSGEFLQEYQHTAWEFTRSRMEQSMNHLLKRLADFPPSTVIGINLGFNPDGNSLGDESAIYWANEIAKTNPIRTWDFSLTEGENNVIPHYRFERLFAQRVREQNSAPYQGGICFTMTPRLNQLSLWESAQSFLNIEADHTELAELFFEKLFGRGGREIVRYLPLFEVVKDWGNYQNVDIESAEYHRSMTQLLDLLESLTPNSGFPFQPEPAVYKKELLFFARFFSDLSSSQPDYDELRDRYWRHVYAIYDSLPQHVDPRPKRATDRLIDTFRRSSADKNSRIDGKWKE